jgi:hypothetical protein
MRERGDRLAGHDPGERLVMPAGNRQRAARHESAQERLDHQRAAECLEHHHDVEPAAAEAARRLVEQGRDDAEFAQLLPDRRIIPRLAIGARVARLDRIAVTQCPHERIGQHAAIVGVLEVHVLRDPIWLWR